MIIKEKRPSETGQKEQEPKGITPGQEQETPISKEVPPQPETPPPVGGPPQENPLETPKPKEEGLTQEPNLEVDEENTRNEHAPRDAGKLNTLEEANRYERIVREEQEKK